MLISDVEAITGLSRKSIRLYEAKGLLSAKRAENSYRYFDEQTVEKLKCIAVLRRVGIPIADIQLWQSGVISAEEMFSKRIHQLKSESYARADQISLCYRLMENSDTGLWWELAGLGKKSRDALFD
ncbi:MAG TPA: MerR family transcriptional regulator, partial [Bacillota bacterium]|nr:MerR family transcriptional regulator [Clostridiales bacterium]HPT85693.1 MerR family transcriptional regulator [Bacillota bacterium]